MTLFRFKWLRRLIRKKTAPIPYDVASKNKQRLSFLYAFFAWNAFGFVMYQIFKGKVDWAVHHGAPKDDSTPAQRYARILGVDNAKVIRIGMRGKEEYEIDNRDLNNEESAINVE